MRTFMLAAALLPLLSGTASAASWYHIGGNTKTQSYVDLDSLRPIGGKIIAVTMSIYVEPLDGGVHASQIRSEYDCPGNYFRTLEYSYFDASHALTSTEASETINEHKTPKPGSINESMMNFICYRKGGDAVGDPFASAAAQFAAQ